MRLQFFGDTGGLGARDIRHRHGGSRLAKGKGDRPAYTLARAGYQRRSAGQTEPLQDRAGGEHGIRGGGGVMGRLVTHRVPVLPPYTARRDASSAPGCLNVFGKFWAMPVKKLHKHSALACLV